VLTDFGEDKCVPAFTARWTLVTAQYSTVPDEDWSVPLEGRMGGRDLGRSEGERKEGRKEGREGGRQERRREGW